MKAKGAQACRLLQGAATGSCHVTLCKRRQIGAHTFCILSKSRLVACRAWGSQTATALCLHCHFRIDSKLQVSIRLPKPFSTACWLDTYRPDAGCSVMSVLPSGQQHATGCMLASAWASAGDASGQEGPLMYCCCRHNCQTAADKPCNTKLAECAWD